MLRRCCHGPLDFLDALPILFQRIDILKYCSPGLPYLLVFSWTSRGPERLQVQHGACCYQGAINQVLDPIANSFDVDTSLRAGIDEESCYCHACSRGFPTSRAISARNSRYSATMRRRTTSRRDSLTVSLGELVPSNFCAS